MGILLNLWLRVPATFRLRVYHILIYVGSRLYGPTNSERCFRLPFNLYAKHCQISEADTMRYISNHTRILIPTTIDVLQDRYDPLIIMTRIAGDPIMGRLKTMSVAERSLLASDLKNSFDQLRSLPPPSEGPRIRGAGGGSFTCHRIGWDPVGPFTTEQDFYQFLYDRSYLKFQTHLKEYGRKVHAIPHRICLSHNDINPHNILIDSRGRLTGIIDWECAAWLPEYWDYTRSYFYKDEYYEWQKLMDDIFGVWKEELDVEREMWKYNDPY